MQSNFLIFLFGFALMLDNFSYNRYGILSFKGLCIRFAGSNGVKRSVSVEP